MAGRIALDLKAFKHMKSDDKSTTLRHKDGHVLTLAHKALAPENQKQLEALKGMSEQAQTPQDNEEQQADKPKMAQGGMYSGNMPGQPTYQAEGGKMGISHKHQIPPAHYDEGGQVDAAQTTQANAEKIALLHQQQLAILANNPRPTPEQTAQLIAISKQVEALAPPPPQNAQPASMQEQAAAQVGSAPQGLQHIPEGNNPFKMMEMTRGAQSYDKGGRVNMAGAGEVTVNDDAPADIQALQQAQIEKEVQAADPFMPTGMPMASGPSGQASVPVAAPVRPSPEQLRDAEIAKNLSKLPPSSEDLDNAAKQELAAQQLLDQTNSGKMPAASGTAAAAAPSANPYDPEALLQSGYGKRLAGIEQEAQAKGSLGKESARILDDTVRNQTEAQAEYQRQLKDLNKEREDHIADIKTGHIDPNKYWTGDPNTGAGGHSKIAAAIGMILGGFQPTGQPNAAINFLKYQMEQNLDAQKQNLNSKQNLLAANLRQYGNVRDALDMTRIMQHDIAANELNSAAATAQTPMAKAAALNASGQLQMESAPLFQQFAMRRAMINLANNPNGNPGAIDQMLGYLRVTNPEMAKEMESRYVPSVGIASTPVPNDVRGQLIAKQQFGQAIKDMRDWAAKHSGSLNPKDIVEGRTKAANVQNLYRQGINGGVFKQGEQSFISGIIDSEPTKFFNSVRVLPKLDEAARENNMSLNVLKRGYGLPAQQEAVQPQYKTVHGVRYMRGPNGEAIPVR